MQIDIEEQIHVIQHELINTNCYRCAVRLGKVLDRLYAERRSLIRKESKDIGIALSPHYQVERVSRN